MMMAPHSTGKKRKMTNLVRQKATKQKPTSVSLNKQNTDKTPNTPPNQCLILPSVTPSESEVPATGTEPDSRCEISETPTCNPCSDTRKEEAGKMCDTLSEIKKN